MFECPFRQLSLYNIIEIIEKGNFFVFHCRAFDPISVLASLAFLAFLLQSFAALFDRTRSMIPTIVSSRQLKSDYNDQLTEVEKRVMRAIEEYVRILKIIIT